MQYNIITKGRGVQHGDHLMARTEIPLPQKLSTGYDVEPILGCWVWRHSRCNGYGQVGYQGRVRYVHILMYEQLHGPVPPGLVIRHTCDTRACYNPAHLILGTKGQNRRDALMRGRDPHTKLDPAMAQAIRDLHAQGIDPTSMAEALGVDRQVVYNVCKGRTWNW